MRSQYALYLQLLLLSLMPASAKPSRLTISQRASQTTEIARKLVLQRLESTQLFRHGRTTSISLEL